MVTVTTALARDPRARSAGRLPWLLAAGAVALEIAYPLLDAGIARDRVTVATVVTFSGASITHAARVLGGRDTAWLLAVTVGGGFAVELVGLRTGWPFGRYRYDDGLGQRLAGVPVVVPLAWAMMAWPALLAGARLTRRHRWALPVAAGWALAGWDVFLDPQMVDAGHWSWTNPVPALPGVAGVPVQNFAAWLAVGVAMAALLAPLARRPVPHAQPLTLYLWTYFSSILANLVWFHRPGVALAGGLAMGIVVWPLVRALWRG